MPEYYSKNLASRPESRFQTLKIKKKLVQAKESYKRFIRTRSRRARNVPRMEIPTAPPSPSPVRQGRALRRHDTLFFEPQPTPATNESDIQKSSSKQETAPETNADDSSLSVISDSSQDTLEECYREVALQNTPLSELPPGVSLEQYVERSMNRRRLAGFLAYAFGLEKGSSYGSTSSSTS
ncbi:hypothetical protein F5878DRAFT_666903 [Lentinula raphanica]|uniref:Uncharacterized protein n=1 Tax=Lentinula raphanica TaxID=153919 RepID=A0AA38NWY6_9AGAR|nr:hypothetical protein F5878DRAFT_666903 [Lentinula raphanica]